MTLRDSRQAAGMAGPVLLFQDGVFNRHSGCDKTDPALIRQSVAVFQAIFPNGVVMGTAGENLGIARNIHRAERWVFEDGGYECGLFFEDDMVLSPGYMAVMRRLHALALREPRIAMFSAYGDDIALPAADQFRERGAVGPMHHNWGFGLMRHAWHEREQRMGAYTRLLDAVDYRDRPTLDIARWYAGMGWPPMPTNQDLAKNITLNTLGYVRISTRAVLARNIGEVGQNYAPEEFSRLGFSRAEMFEDSHSAEDIAPALPSPEEIEAQLLEERQRFMAKRLSLHDLMTDPAFARIAAFMPLLAPPAPGEARHTVHSAIGFYRDDMWFGPNGSFVIHGEAHADRVEIAGIHGSHLPADATLDFMLNGEVLATLQVVPGQDFRVVLPLPPNSAMLSKTVSTWGSHVLDPFSAGTGSDRRPLAWRLLWVVLHHPHGAVTLDEDALREEFAA
ncbi:hypothetical protein EOD42_07050 [Rhodovarius crocodyli]|uniref:Uncharacterized protein n=1 Tax=Rhodovarius crocodyli TaxID=1979269 RepID=A0A437MJ08_9PROT|nr:hypothetical protein [Rhodovarius crocodyli]RVT97575.1 hypothetical protein EOD42_07050 [Rhodovarius crocodyli]